MGLSDRPVCNIRYCHRDPASWILAGFALLEQDGVLRIRKVEQFDRFLEQDLYQHNNIVEVEIEGHRIVFDTENGYRSFLRPALFDDQIEHVDAYFKANCDPARYEGLRNRDKVHPFVAGTFTATCPGNPYDRMQVFRDGVSLSELKRFASVLKHRAAYLREYDYRNVECENTFSDYSLLFWSRLSPVYTNVERMKQSYSFLSPEELETLVRQTLDIQREMNRRRIVICTTLKKEYGSAFIGGIANDEYARKTVPELITYDERVTTRKRFLETMHTGVIGVISIGHQYCIGARFGELLASGRAILSDPFQYVLPGGCSDGKNYLSFRSGSELYEKAELLLHDTDAVHKMELQNRKYYHEHFEPRSCVRDALHTAFPAHEGFWRQPTEREATTQ